MVGSREIERTPMERIEFAIDGRPTIVATAAGGERAAPVVLLHGGGQTRHSWDKATARLAELGFRVIALDLRGHGDSGWAPDGDYAIDAYAGDVRAVLTRIGRPAAVVGASLGGRAALVAAGEPPAACIAALILVDISSRPAEDGINQIREFMQRTIAGFDSVEEASAAVSRYMPHRKPPKDLSGLRKNLRRREDGRWYWHWDPRTRQGAAIVTDRAAHDARLEAAARSIGAPALVLRGAGSELVKEEQARAFAALFARGEYLEIEGARHMLAGDQNDAFVRGVADFLVRSVGSRDSPRPYTAPDPQ